MLFGGRRVAEIARADIEGLLGVVAEGTGVDYKRDVGTNDDAKREFAADISSFANTEGGYILLGVAEEEGVATSIDGVQVNDLDAEILRLENLARDTVAPRLPAFEVGPVDADGRVVLVIRIGRSWSAPHMVTFRNSSKFYRRNSAGKYQLDVDEIRGAFMRAIEGAAAVRRFHNERSEIVTRNLLPGLTLDGGPKFVVHLVPSGALEGWASIDVAAATAFPSFRPFYSDIGMGLPTRFTIDGATVTDAVAGHPASRYFLLFRSGVIEAVDAALFGARPAELLGSPFERTMVDDVSRCLAMQRDRGVEPPVYLLTTIIGADGARIVPPGNPIEPYGGWSRIDRSPVQLPEVVFDDFDTDVPTAVRPLFDAFWQSGGFLRSPNYNQDGEWQRPPG